MLGYMSRQSPSGLPSSLQGTSWDTKERIKPVGAGGGTQPGARRRQGPGAESALPGVADKHVGGSEPGVIPLHASLLVQHQDVGPETVGGQDSLVCVCLGRSIADR